jgi:hypothetical protein
MATATLRKRLAQLQADLTALHHREPPALMRLRSDPARLLADAGMVPDPWQAELLRSSAGRVLLLCSRQAGKSQTAAALALREALLQPGSLVLLLSPTLRQSGELFKDKVKRLYYALGCPVPTRQESALTMELVNGSRIISLPGDEGTVRGYSGARLLILDEAARIADELYQSVRPMLATSRGKLVALSTPWGKRGWFYKEWIEPGPWKRVKITAEQCRRITAEFLAEDRQHLGERWYRQEYECDFAEMLGSVFREEDIAQARSQSIPSIFGDY